jgi:hypothetical protein
MTTVTENTLLTFTDEGFQAFLDSRNEPGWLTEIRKTAWERFKALPWPSSKDEEWMRTDIRLFHLEKFHIPSSRGSAQTAAPVLADGVELVGSAVACDGVSTGTASLDPSAAARIIPLQDEGEAKRGFLPLHMEVDMLAATPDDPHGLPSSMALMPNYPNPFNPRTTIRYQIRVDATVRLAIYTLDGKLVKELANGARTAGFHTEDWDGRNDAGREMPSGVYLTRLFAGSYLGVQKMHLVR